jgi:hypothetical protein
MEHQDWTTVTFKKKPKVETNKTNINYTESKIRVDSDGDEYRKIYKLSPEEIKEYTKYRVDLKLTRAELAKKINCLQSDIDALELGKPSSSQIGGKLKTFLKKEIAKLSKLPKVV